MSNILTALFPNFNGCTLEVRMRYYIPYFILDFCDMSTLAQLRSPLYTHTHLYVRWWSYIRQMQQVRLVNMTIPTGAFVYIHQASWYIYGACIAVILFTHDGFHSHHRYCQQQYCSTPHDGIPSWPCPYLRSLWRGTTDHMLFVYEICLKAFAV